MSVLAIDVSSERLSRITQWLDACGVVLRVAAPMVDLLVRLSLAKAFFAPGMLPSNPFFEFGPAGWPTIIVQIVGPTLLAIGLWVRPISLLMLLLTLLAQNSGPPQDEHLFWAVLFGWYVSQGAASLSLDHFLAKGLGLSPLAVRGAGHGGVPLVRSACQPHISPLSAALARGGPARSRGCAGDAACDGTGYAAALR